MRYELRLHRLFLTMLATVLTGIVTFIFYLSFHPADVWIEASVSLAVVIIIATTLVYMGMAEGIIALQFGTKHKRELLGYLVLGLISLTSGLYLALSETASLSMIALVVSPHALLFGIAEVRISQHMQHHSKERRALLLFGVSEVALAVALILGSLMSSRSVATLLGYGAATTSFQLLAFLFYKSRRPQHTKIHMDT